jgi:hypothetical protein
MAKRVFSSPEELAEASRASARKYRDRRIQAGMVFREAQQEWHAAWAEWAEAPGTVSDEEIQAHVEQDASPQNLPSNVSAKWPSLGFLSPAFAHLIDGMRKALVPALAFCLMLSLGINVWWSYNHIEQPLIRGPESPMSQQPTSFTTSPRDLQAAANSLANQILYVVPVGERLRVTITDFQDGKGGASDLGKEIASRLKARLAQSPRIFLVEPRYLEDALTQLQLDWSALTEPTTAQQVGQLAEVDAVVMGTVSDVSNQINLDSRMVDLATAQTILRTVIPILDGETLATTGDAK